MKSKKKAQARERQEKMRTAYRNEKMKAQIRAKNERIALAKKTSLDEDAALEEAFYLAQKEQNTDKLVVLETEAWCLEDKAEGQAKEEPLFSEADGEAFEKIDGVDEEGPQLVELPLDQRLIKTKFCC